MRHNDCLTKIMLLFLHKCINYGYVARYAYVYRYLFTFVVAETAPETVSVVRKTKPKHVSV